MEIQIKALRADDREGWFPLWRGYQAFYEVDIAETVTEATWSRMLDRSEPMHGALAMLEGKPVGLVHFLFHRSTWTIGAVCYLQDLFVAPGARGQGIGEKLIGYVYDVAREAGSPEVYWLTHETNRTAMKLYDRIADRPGFVQYSRTLG
ncbi:MAG TPA: GNAT family N-acetyltransferase [Alphaproteobacteria bacterium]|jgi:GNAT superfamily N-acetyltransferase|nr:GNAT family N-acetyltransferase [Alphaproteobacteria bacterium]